MYISGHPVYIKCGPFKICVLFSEHQVDIRKGQIVQICTRGRWNNDVLIFVAHANAAHSNHPINGSAAKDNNGQLCPFEAFVGDTLATYVTVNLPQIGKAHAALLTMGDENIINLKFNMTSYAEPGKYYS